MFLEKDKPDDEASMFPTFSYASNLRQILARLKYCKKQMIKRVNSVSLISCSQFGSLSNKFTNMTFPYSLTHEIYTKVE
jgi:hypothetical protein